MRTVRRAVFVCAISCVLALALASLSLPQAHAAVTLVSFEATSDGQRVHLTWETASEIDMIGFYILRADSAAGEFSRIPFGSPTLVFAYGGVIGGSYELWDTAVTPGRTYYYKLEALETTGHADFFGPIEVTVGAPATSTPTRTPTPTATSAPASATATATTPPPTQRPVVPTSTPTPRPASATPTGGALYPSATAAVRLPSTPTATLGPSPLSTANAVAGPVGADPSDPGSQGGEVPPAAPASAEASGGAEGQSQPTALVLTAPTDIPTITRQAPASPTPRPRRTASPRGVAASSEGARAANIGLPLWALVPAAIVGLGTLAACGFAVWRLWRAR